MQREMSERLVDEFARTFADPALFSAEILRQPLRAYQVAPARAIVQAALSGRGGVFAVMMARQAGKNQTSAHIEALLLNAYRRRGGQIVKAAPTFRPQALTSLLRLQGALEGAVLPLRPIRERGYMLRLDRARALFLSAAPGANVVGATANLLLEADEAQDVDEVKWSKDFRPMAASTNAVSVLWGTAWTSRTLLARTIRLLRDQEARDGARRVFIVPWQTVAEELPAYGDFVRGEIERLGPMHPLIQTQYELREIDEQAGMFPPATRALMQGRHERHRQAIEGREYALLIDVAGPAPRGGPAAGQAALPGMDAVARSDALSVGGWSGFGANRPTRDATALTVVEIVRGELGLARFLVADRYLWVGAPHTELYGAILHLAELWCATRLVVDATGVGAGLASFLSQSLGARVTPFIFTAQSKRELGWRFLGLCHSGRFLDHRDDGGPEWRQFWREVQAAEYEVLPGPGQLMRWGVRDPAIHDDLLISAALCAALDRDAAPAPGPSHVIEAGDVLGGDSPRRRGGFTTETRRTQSFLFSPLDG